MLCGVDKGWSSRCLAWVTALDLNLFCLFQADVRDEEALYQAFQGVDCVFHVASYGMSGAEKVRLPLTPEPGRVVFKSCPTHHTLMPKYLFLIVLRLSKDALGIHDLKHQFWYLPPG